LFLALPREEGADFGRVAERVIWTAEVPLILSTRSLSTSFWLARRIDFPGSKNTRVVALVLCTFHIAYRVCLETKGSNEVGFEIGVPVAEVAHPAKLYPDLRRVISEDVGSFNLSPPAT
jgi:hypothetical protein